MKMTVSVLAIAVFGALTGHAMAQDAFVNQDLAKDAVVDLEDQIRDDAKRDVAQFGNEGRIVGWDGSFALRGALTAGNTKTADLGFGARFSYFDGVNGHRFNGSYGMASEDGTRTKDSLVLGYDYTRDFSDQFYAYGKLTGTYDKFGALKSDIFAGAGVGFRVIDTAQTQWSVQAGPGFRQAYNQNDDVVIESAAAAVSSYYSTKLTETLSLSNDTDVLWSEDNTRVTNSLGVNVAVSESLALRTSLDTTYNSDPAAGFKNTDSNLGLSLVYNFN